MENAPRKIIYHRGLTGKEIFYLCFTGAILVLEGLFLLNLFVRHYVLEAGPIDYILPLAGMVVFAMLYSIAPILSSRPSITISVFLAASFASVLFVPLRLESFLAVALIFLSLIHAFHSIRSRDLHAATFNPFSAVQSGLASVFTALIFLASFYYLYSQILRPPLLFSAEFIRDTVSVAVREEGLVLGSLPKEDVSRAIAARIDSSIGPYRPFLPYLLTFFFFFTAKSITYILYWLIPPIIVAVLKLMRAVGVVRQEKVRIETERTFLFF